MPSKDVRRLRFKSHRSDATRRGIPFLFTFEEWWGVWKASGYWERRGSRKGQYVMARHGDVGPYAIDNVSIITSDENNRAAAEKQRASVIASNRTRTCSAVTRAKLSAASKARARLRAPQLVEAAR